MRRRAITELVLQIIIETDPIKKSSLQKRLSELEEQIAAEITIAPEEEAVTPISLHDLKRSGFHCNF